MAKAIKQVVEMGTELDSDERNILSVAYKNLVANRRSAWRVINTYEQRASKSANSESRVKITQEYRRDLEKEIREICGEVLVILF